MPPGEKTLNAYVLVERWPMNADPAPNEAPSSSFSLAAVEKTRIPRERNHQRSAVLKVYGELIFRHSNGYRARALKVIH